MDRTALRGIAVVSLMALCLEIIEVQFSILDPVNYNFLLLLNCSKGPCPQYPWDKYFRSPTAWMYASRYLLPVLGGLLASAWLGYVRALHVGGVIMLLSTVLMSVAGFIPGIQWPSSVYSIIAWSLLPLFIGLTQPNILYGMFRWVRQGKYCTIVAALYYMVSSSAGFLADLFEYYLNYYVNPFHRILFLITLTILFVALIFILPKESDQRPYTIPRRGCNYRYIRYFYIFSGITPFLIASVKDTQNAVQFSELSYFLNGTYRPQEWDNVTDLPTVLRTCCPLGFSALLMLIVFVAPRQLPVQHRMLTGVLLKTAAAVILTIFTAVDYKDPDQTVTIALFSVASVLDAAAQVLVLTANYEIARGISPPSSKSFVYGIMLTVWVFPYVISNMMLLGLNSFAIIMSPAPGENPRFYIFHLTTLVLLIICFIYLKSFVLPCALRLMETTRYDYPEIADTSPINEESQPLLGVVDQARSSDPNRT